ncbi:MAG TPA: response regulator [Thermoanaerobaculia bacterium]|nr:response regulator [Thermoanaerobaculia bacterium]
MFSIAGCFVGAAQMMSEQHRQVLVVDDDPVVRSILGTALRQRSLLYDEAADGAEAIRLLRENAYAVVLLDIMMPGVNGFEVLDAIDPTAANTPVVLVVSGADRAVLERLDARRIHGVVKKPFDPEEIASVVAACAEIRGRSTFETMAFATMMTGAPLIAFFKL